MPEVIIDGRGSASTLLVNPDGSINVSGTFAISGAIHIGSVSANVDSIYIQSGASLFGHLSNEIIRKSSGSPAIDYVFGNIMEAFMIDNLGSSPIYFALDGAANPESSGTGFIDLLSFRSFDCRVGSISVQGSGITSPSVQVVGLR